jgi:hypothetical protein
VLSIGWEGFPPLTAMVIGVFAVAVLCAAAAVTLNGMVHLLRVRVFLPEDEERQAVLSPSNTPPEEAEWKVRCLLLGN